MTTGKGNRVEWGAGGKGNRMGWETVKRREAFWVRFWLDSKLGKKFQSVCGTWSMCLPACLPACLFVCQLLSLLPVCLPAIYLHGHVPGEKGRQTDR